MAACHVRAIQKMNGDFNDLTDFLIMQVIATDIGWNGEPCNTSYRTIAARARVHYNTVASRVEKLAEQGHLITERRGKYIYYSLPFECDNGKRLSQQPERLSQPPEGQYDNAGCDNEERLSQIEATLSQLSQQIITISEKIITMNQREDVTKVSKVRSKEYIYTEPQEYPDPETEHQRIAIRTEIATQVKTTMWDRNQKDFDSAADALMEMGAKPDRIKGFGEWWKVNGHYKGKPALKSFMENFSSYLAGETLSKPNMNGQHPAGKQEDLPKVIGEF